MGEIVRSKRQDQGWRDRQGAEVFARLAATTLRRLRADRARMPDGSQPLLTYLEQHLFDPNLTIRKLLTACGIPGDDRAVQAVFRVALGERPLHYIETLRLELAARLLKTTQIRLTWIATRLGYSSLRVFSQAFQRRFGERPLSFRQRTQQELAQEKLHREIPDLRARTADLLCSFAAVERVVEGARATFAQLTQPPHSALSSAGLEVVRQAVQSLQRALWVYKGELLEEAESVAWVPGLSFSADLQAHATKVEDLVLALQQDLDQLTPAPTHGLP